VIGKISDKQYESFARGFYGRDATKVEEIVADFIESYPTDPTDGDWEDVWMLGGDGIWVLSPAGEDALQKFAQGWLIADYRHPLCKNCGDRPPYPGDTICQECCNELDPHEPDCVCKWCGERPPTQEDDIRQECINELDPA